MTLNNTLKNNKICVWLNNNKIAIEIVVAVMYFAALFVWGIVQPITNQPDELTRYLVPYYIYTSGHLPSGNVEELLVRGYGISYGFFPCLPYLCMAVAMKFVSLFTTGSYAILMGARVVNMLAGVVTYLFVRRIAKLIATNEWNGWLFTLMVCFWPQFMFVFTYTNCDAFALMSVAIIIYAIVKGVVIGWDIKTCIIGAVGISICLLSYFNAYGVIVAAFIVFVLSFIDHAEVDEHSENSFKKKHFEYKACIKYGLIITGIVIALAGWWFIRNAILYNGDFIGLKSSDAFAEINAVDYLKPSKRDTLKNNGESMFVLLKDSSYMFLLKQSFFGRFGNMSLAAPNYVIRFFKLLLTGGIICLVIPNKNRVINGYKHLIIDIGLVIAVVIPVFLGFYYSYASDYQPQGRYILPALIPLLCFVCFGFNNLSEAYTFFNSKYEDIFKLAYRCIVICLCIYMVLTTIGCISLIWREYSPILSETFSFVFTGNIYE